GCPSEPGRFGGRRPRESCPVLAGSARRRAVPPARLTMPARGWWDADRLRSHVADANDGIIAVAGIVEGLTGAGASDVVVFAAVLAAAVSGAVALGAAKYSESSTEREGEAALIAEERRRLEMGPEEELAELAALYEARGLSAGLARAVAEELSAPRRARRPARRRLRHQERHTRVGSVARGCRRGHRFRAGIVALDPDRVVRAARPAERNGERRRVPGLGDDLIARSPAERHERTPGPGSQPYPRRGHDGPDPAGRMAAPDVSGEVAALPDGCSRDAGVVEGPRMHRRRRNLIAIGFVTFLAGWLAWKVLLTKSKIPASPPAARTERPR